MKRRQQVCSQKVKKVNIMVKKCKLKCGLLAWTYFPKIRPGVKGQQIFLYCFIVLGVFCGFPDFC